MSATLDSSRRPRSSRSPGAHPGLILVLAMMAALAAVVSPAAARTPPRAHAAYAQQCPDPYPAQRDPGNPLMLPQAPGPNPLNGAQFFVAGPRHGPAAEAIATLLGRDPSKYPVSYSWARFSDDLSHGALLAKLNADPALAWKVHMLEKIASGPETNRFSIFSGGGGPGAIFGQVQKIFCLNLTADPGTIPIISTYFMHPVVGGCPTPAMMSAMGPAFRRRVDELAAGVANRPAVVLVENDAIGSSRCVQSKGSLPQWEADLRYETGAMAALPHTVVYLEGGYSDSNGPGYTARVLEASGVGRIRGFWTNDTHSQWTINEIRWGEQVSRLAHGADFVINTAGNGQGPLLNRHPTTQGVEDLCNAPGRGIGPRPTTDTGFAHVDAFLWSGVPGGSSGHCHGGTASGTFWLAGAISLAAHAQGKLGPGYPADPY
ncbi:MAG TPA: glycoside hydrolase family 6 protein [Solirubrobacteraceae bacterium]